MSSPKLSIAFITYNHEPYLKKALDGILRQKVDFEYEIVVGEDCSTDHTRDILMDYDEHYPGMFRLLFREKNLGRPTLNVYQTSMECRGEYIAYLEGDDYWTDENKLQKQVDFLDASPEYEACTHTCMLVGRDCEELEDLSPMQLYTWSGDYGFEDLKTKPYWPGQTATVVTRNFWHDGRYDYTILYRAHDFIDDGVILLFMVLHGKIMRMDDVMSAWRYISKDNGGNWNSLKLHRNEMMEQCYMKCTMLQWCEENVGLTHFGRKKAKSDFKTALSVFLKHTSR